MMLSVKQGGIKYHFLSLWCIYIYIYIYIYIPKTIYIYKYIYNIYMRKKKAGTSSLKKINKNSFYYFIYFSKYLLISNIFILWANCCIGT